MCLFLEQPNIDINEGAPLCRAALSHDEDIVHLLLKQPNIDVNRVHEDWSRAVDCVATHGNEDLVLLFLKQPDIDVNQ